MTTPTYNMNEILIPTPQDRSMSKKETSKKVKEKVAHGTYKVEIGVVKAIVARKIRVKQSSSSNVWKNPILIHVMKKILKRNQIMMKKKNKKLKLIFRNENQ